MTREFQMPRRRGLGADFGFLASPPRAERIVARAQVLCALLLRAELEAHPDRTQATELLATVCTWLGRAGADEELETPERALLGTLPGLLDAGQRERSGWLGEGAAVLAWAMRRLPVSPPGVAAEATAVATALEFLGAPATPLHTRARLRPRADLLAAFELLDLAESRLRQALEAPDAVSLASWRGPGYRWPEDIQPYEFAGDDLALDGQPLYAVPAARLRAAWRAACERRRASAWLLGAASVWSEVPASAAAG